MAPSSGPTDPSEAFPILFRGRWPATALDASIASIDVAGLCQQYSALRKSAPRRSLTGKRFFVEHAEHSPANAASNRGEEHLAVALLNLGRRWPRPAGGWVRMLDYQVPLKARQADARIGKIDLLGVTDQGQLAVIELKAAAHNAQRRDAPPAALMEGLRYAAIVQAELDAIVDEAEQRYATKVSRSPPIIQLLAPLSWWRDWLNLKASRNWASALSTLLSELKSSLGITVECMALEDIPPSYAKNGRGPRLDRVPEIYPIRLGERAPIGEALILSPPGRRAMADYHEDLLHTAWSWADRHHVGQLDGGKREGRWPVLRRALRAENVLVPPDGPGVDEVRALIAPSKRHTHFGSLRSSQVLAQSVFGTLAVSDRLDVLACIRAECGRPAFFATHGGWAVGFEDEVKGLNEPRPTSIDVLLSSPSQRVAIECKFTEEEFGTCSRTRLQPKDPEYAEQHCDGNYRMQTGRSERCALTAIGIDYWYHLPRLFAWPADVDHQPCPFGAVYQLGRNALAATLTPNGVVRPDGHLDLPSL